MMLLKVLIGICIFTLCYKYFNRFKKVDKQMIKEINELKNQRGGSSSSNKNKLLEFVPKWITQDELDKLGNPYKLNVVTYTLIKIILPLIFFIRILEYTKNIFIAVVTGVLGFFLIDYMHNKRNDSDLKLLLLDLEGVYDSIIFNVRAGESLGIALSEVYTVARRSKRLRKALLRLSARINMTANIEEALEDFKKQFNFTETNLFANSLKQALETGLVENVLDGQAMQVKRQNAEYLKLRNSKIPNKIMVYGLLFTFGIIALVVFIIGSDIGNGLNQIFI